MRFGVNYIPSKAWLHRWLDWDEAAVDADLQAIARHGMDHIRAHLIWPYFQVDPARMSAAAMENLKSFVKLCEKNGLDFCLSLFTGWMSGSSFFPAWLTPLGDPAGRKNMFTDPSMIAAEEFYVRRIAEVVVSSPRFLGFDLGNEVSAIVCVFGMQQELDACDAWHTRMISLCRELAPGKLHNSGVDHTPWFGHVAFSRETLANVCDVVALHGWSEFTGARAKNGTMGLESIQIAGFCVELARACNHTEGMQYWLQEFGSTPIWHEDGTTPGDFLRQTLEVMAAQEDVWGVTWWCSHDIDRDLASYHPMEYELGLFSRDNEPRDSALVMKEFAEKQKRGELKPIHRREAVVFDEEEYEKDAWSQISKYMNAVRGGKSPAIVWKRQTSDREYLCRRGIDTLLY